MSVRLSFGQPVIAAQGPTWEEAGWGSHQFPAIRALPDGRLALAYHIVNDRAEDYGLERGWALSSDGGESWGPSAGGRAACHQGPFRYEAALRQVSARRDAQAFQNQ